MLVFDIGICVMDRVFFSVLFGEGKWLLVIELVFVGVDVGVCW